MFTRFQAIIALLVMAFVSASCGDLLGTKVKKKELSGSQFQVQCELDLDKFSVILTENISSQINCLRENLNLFIRVVKTEKPGYLSRVQLEQYLQRYRPDVKPEIIRALKSVFDIGHLITGEDPDYISKETVKKVMDFALVFNEQASLNFGPVFQNETPVSYTLHMNARDRVSAANKKIVEGLRNIYKADRNGEIHKINIIDLLASFTTETTRPGIEKAKKLLFGKKILLGGDEQILTHLELERLILNFDHLLLIALDAVRYKYLILSQDSLLQLLKRDTNDLYDIINQGPLGNRDSEVFFTLNQAIDAAKIFVDADKFDIDKYRTLITEGKKLLMKGNATEVKAKDLNNLFGHAKSLLQTGTVFHRIYAKFAKELNAPGPANIDFDEYRHTYPEHQKELDQFERIVKKYRFMKGAIKLNEQDDNSWSRFRSSFYTKEFHRNPNAMVEIALLEYAIKLVFSTYGSVSPNSDAVGGYSINKDQMRALMLKFENELIDMGLIRPQTAVSNADNISLLGTLFQYQSDKNSVMDVNEGTEFGISLIGALNISDDLFNYMKSQGCKMDQFKRFDPACFRQTFWKGLCSQYRQYYPLMFSYMNAPAKCEDFPNNEMQSVFLDRAIVAARTCMNYTDGAKEEIPYAKGDIMTIMLALMHAETTVMRWDVNNNNLMDADEVDRAYDIYSPALDGFLEGKSPIIKKFKKQIFQYMIKYEQIPDEKQFSSIWKFVKFLLSFNKKAPATRKTIASILVVIGEQNKALQTVPQFDCNLLRDPDHIPRSIPAPSAMKVSYTMSVQELNVALSDTATMINRFSEDDKELLRDELFIFTDDARSGAVTKVSDVRQPHLKQLFTMIASDKVQMASIRASIGEGNDLQKIALAVSSILTE